jgi:hypothetical protein
MISRGISRRVNDRGRVLLRYVQGVAPVIGKAPANRSFEQTDPRVASANGRARHVLLASVLVRRVGTEGLSSPRPPVPLWQQGSPALAGRLVKNQVCPIHQATNHPSLLRTICLMRKIFSMLPLERRQRNLRAAAAPTAKASHPKKSPLYDSHPRW